MTDFVLDELFPLQKGLDERIEEEHKVTYDSTHYKRVLALLVELGEFSNETRCFKYWSLKAPSEKDVILEEYVDALHFFLSLGIPLGAEHYTHKFRPDEKELTLQILKTYHAVTHLLERYEAKEYALAFSSFLNIMPLIGFSPEDVVGEYKKKLAINYQRQNNKY